MPENNADLTDVFPLLCNNYFIIAVLMSTVYLHDGAFLNLIKSPEDANEEKNLYVPHCPPAIFQFMFLSELLFEFLCWLIKIFSAKPVMFVSHHLACLNFGRHKGDSERISCPQK